MNAFIKFDFAEIFGAKAEHATEGASDGALEVR